MIAAVAGFALGGGCELAMQCDIIIAADNAKFGQPEIKLGIIPGIGGTQRLTHAVGKAKAMDLILTGRMMDAQEAERSGLVARIVPLANLLDEALKTAETIAAMSLPSVLAAKEAVNRAFETSLAEGIRFERRIFHSLFATADQKEGMAAFVAKRPPKFENRTSAVMFRARGFERRTAGMTRFASASRHDRRRVAIPCACRKARTADAGIQRRLRRQRRARRRPAISMRRCRQNGPAHRSRPRRKNPVRRRIEALRAQLRGGAADRRSAALRQRVGDAVERQTAPGCRPRRRAPPGRGHARRKAATAQGRRPYPRRCDRHGRSPAR